MLEKFSENPHPHIVRIRNFFQEGDTYCLVMDFVDGEDLFKIVKMRGKIPEKEAVQYIQQIGSALNTIHKAGLVHRDTHPGNIMLDNDGKAILIDFDIAKDLVPNTQSSIGDVGHSGFAPYEQLIKGSRKPNVDIYCLAATLYYILTGKKPADSNSRKLDNIHLIPPNKHYPISKGVNMAILKGMALEERDRPKTIEKWIELLFSSQTLLSYNFLRFQLFVYECRTFIFGVIEKLIAAINQLLLQIKSTPKKQSLREESNNYREDDYHYNFTVISSLSLDQFFREIRRIPWFSLLKIIIAHGAVSFVLASFFPSLYIWLFLLGYSYCYYWSFWS